MPESLWLSACMPSGDADGIGHLSSRMMLPVSMLVYSSIQRFG
jgi:hypothetical protein